MFSFHVPRVHILEKIDVHAYPWCREAVLFSVKNGIGTLTHATGEDSEKYDYYSQLLLNDMPIMQGKYAVCPTCAGMLATGYGIENIHCPELQEARNCMNAEYQGIQTVAERIKPLLGLLSDGIYLLADIPHAPTDGNGHFFYSVPNCLTDNPATCESYYQRDFFRCVDGFPALLYPTQSAALCSRARVDEYVRRLAESNHPPRALAYHERGFISALLDGHHKACAAAILGKKVECLTILRATSFMFQQDCKYRGDETPIKSVGFSGIRIPAKRGEVMADYANVRRSGKQEKPIQALQDFTLTGVSFPEAEKNAAERYLTVAELADFYAADLENTEMTEELMYEWLRSANGEALVKLRCSLAWFMKTDRERAFGLAKQIVRCSSDFGLLERAWRALCTFQSAETEQLVIDYIVSHTKQDAFWGIVTSYWDT